MNFNRVKEARAFQTKVGERFPINFLKMVSNPDLLLGIGIVLVQNKDFGFLIHLKGVKFGMKTLPQLVSNVEKEVFIEEFQRNAREVKPPWGRIYGD